MVDPTFLIVVAAAILAALVLGWWLGGRAAAPLQAEVAASRDQIEQLRAESADWRDRFNKIGVDLAATAEQANRVPQLEAQLETERRAAAEAQAEAAGLRPLAERAHALDNELRELRQEKDALAAAKAAYERGEAERAQAHQEQLSQLKELEAKVEARFGQLAGQAVETAHDQFLKRAEEKFGATGARNEAKLRELLQPVQLSLERYEKGLTEIEKSRNDSYGALREAVTQLGQSNEIVRRETQRLANVMGASPKARGRWGEEQLRTILESAGLSENVDFSLQSTVSDGDRQLRPDCVINLPGDRCIVVDVKCPLVAFEQAFDEEDEGRRGDFLYQHAKAMETYAGDLGKKGYWKQFDRSPDFVIMFIPGEHFLSAAAERMPKLIETAFQNGVIIASTINMLALAKVMAGMWRQESLASQAKEIAALGKELHARLQTMGAHVVSLGRNLRLATENYNDFVGSLDRSVLSQAKRFEDLKVAEGNKAIADPILIEFTPKVSAKLGGEAAAE